MLGLALAITGCSSSKTDAPAGGASGGGSASSSGGAGGFGAAGASGLSANGGNQELGCKPAKRIDANDNPAAVLLAGTKGMESLIPKIEYVHAIGDNVFYDAPTGVYRVAKAGGTPELLYDNPGYPRMVAGTDRLFFLSAGSILAVPLTGTKVMPATIASNLNADVPNDELLSADATHVYLWMRSTSTVKSVDIASGAVATVATGAGNVNWTFYGDQFYYGDSNDSVYSVKLDGSGMKRLGLADHIEWTLAADASRVYVGGFGSVFLLRAPTEQETVLLKLNRVYVERLVVEGDHLIYSTSGGDLGTVALDGSKCTQMGSVGGRWDWSYDDKYFYYSQGAALYKVPK